MSQAAQLEEDKRKTIGNAEKLVWFFCPKKINHKECLKINV
jgi:hypothetical protein